VAETGDFKAMTPRGATAFLMNKIHFLTLKHDHKTPRTTTGTMIPPFETTFAVPLSCEDCIKDVSSSLYQLDGIHNVSANLQDQLISITGTTAPSKIVSAIEATGRDAILRGSGKAESAAVCILETHASTIQDYVKGLIRMVQVSPTMTIIDLTLKGASPGIYDIIVRERGDISAGAASTGGVWEQQSTSSNGQPPRLSRGVWGTVEVGKNGLGSVFLDRPIQIWEMIGRAITVSKRLEQGKAREQLEKEDADTFVGVVARSAGVWQNEKTVCSCSGKTVWEERKEQTSKGML
jgi:copper chaperone for superoxide dismutase